jgi:Glycosyltransferase like family 2
MSHTHQEDRSEAVGMTMRSGDPRIQDSVNLGSPSLRTSVAQGTGQSGPDSDLTVIVLTRRRMHLLDRALRSLAAQRDIALRAIVVVDECQPSVEYLEALPSSFGAIRSLRWVHVTREQGERSGPGRVARLREKAVSQVATSWCGFLDDDNVLETEHFSTLLQCAVRSPAPAAHSWRSLWTRDGRPYPLSGRHPWCHDPHAAARLFAQYEAAGIYRRHSNLVRDQVVPHCRSRSMVDTSEWILRTAFLVQLGFCQEYTVEDWQLGRTEDSKLLDQIVEQGVPIPSTCRPTLRYYFGGYSNDPSHEAAALAGWLP